MTESMEFLATVPKGMETLLTAELRELGIVHSKPGRGRVEFSGDLESAYRLCLWSRIANRVLMPIERFDAETPDDLYNGIRGVDWSAHMAPDATLAVRFQGTHGEIQHSRYAMLRIKDAIVDQFRDATSLRPSIERDQPDLRIDVRLHRGRALVSLDLSGASLHRRGYRTQTRAAPLKENLAAGILLFAGWPEIAKQGGALVDPMCGSGTFPVEAALMAADVAPGLSRAYFGFLGWKGHRPELWEKLLSEARSRNKQGLTGLPPIIGYDSDKSAVHAARDNLERAGLRGYARIEQRQLDCAGPPDNEVSSGLLVVNPPYGERLTPDEGLGRLYKVLGDILRSRFGGWRAAVFTGNPGLAYRFRLKAGETRHLNNGPIECRLFLYHLPSSKTHLNKDRESFAAAKQKTGDTPSADGRAMLANRLRKNLKALRRWVDRESIACYRVYDADLPEYALAVDIYRGETSWLHVQEYQAPASVDRGKAEARLRQALEVISEILEIPASRIALKQRRMQKGKGQYTKFNQTGKFIQVREGHCDLLVNLWDYLDTGLFLDHRITRGILGQMAHGKRFLNLFGYTGAATVHAAAGGAAGTTTVDLSRTYLDWAERNLALNGFRGERHRLIQADCLQWLDKAASDPDRPQFDLIFLDPPTFSNSKRMLHTFDVQRDHARVLRQASRLLSPHGTLVFSTNSRRFRIDAKALSGLVLEDITKQTIPPDFKRNPRIHRCWRISLE